jgi:hypothetical protein
MSDKKVEMAAKETKRLPPNLYTLGVLHVVTKVWVFGAYPEYFALYCLI